MQNQQAREVGSASEQTQSQSKVAVIGSGFGGLGLAWHLKQAGIDDLVLFEKAADLGGTWRENTYPGSGCDVPSHYYSFSFEAHYPWRWRYAKQAEIFAYQQHVAKKYDLLRHIQFNTGVQGARYDASRQRWLITLDNGRVHEAQFLVSAVGQLNRPKTLNIPGLESFTGESFHSAEWNHDYDLNGKKVAVIGTGASAVQFLPEIAKQVQQLHLFQRTPGWTVPKGDKKFSEREMRLLKKFPIIHDLDRKRVFALTEFLGMAYRGNSLVEKAVTALAKLHLRRQVKDEALREALTPDFAVGCKRILLSNEWYPAICRDNVELVTDGIAAIEGNTVLSENGDRRDVDAIIHSTGFQATDFLMPMSITNATGTELHDTWQDGAEAYFGLNVSGFPNFFMLYGPNTNLGSGSIIYMLETQQRYITALLQHQQQQGWQAFEVTQQAQANFVTEMQKRTEATTYSGDCQSWYKTADGRNTNTWVGSQREYAKRLADIDHKAYEYHAA